MLVCDRRSMYRGPTISQETYELLESKFNLHAATIPSLFLTWGVWSKHGALDDSGSISPLSIVIKVPQKVEIANYLLSLTYDFKTRSTTAFLCGGGAALYRPRTDEGLGWQLEQIKSLLKSSHRSWDHPLLLPAILLRTHSERVEIRANNLERDLIALEDELGVTVAGAAGKQGYRDNWPECVDLKKATQGLHSVTPQILFVKKLCDTLKRLGDFLLGLEGDLTRMDHPTDKISSSELRSEILYSMSLIEGLLGALENMRERAQLQIDLVSRGQWTLPQTSNQE
jgi:hypothetical protein